jgi:CHAT domain-containing protein
LPNTLPEVERISALLQQKNLQTTLLTGAAGSETAVKSLCATADPGILHFATHGFFFEKKSPATGTLHLATAENPMFRSGIILAGANPAWRGESGTGMQDDGILTADEISLLPLRNTALVVLSACETGLGDVHDDEGVYGLQRAFRLAGAQNIVMSLWRVPDAQTRSFMEHFYTALLVDGDVRKAFRSARQTMRVEFSNPFYWAGFVLLE